MALKDNYTIPTDGSTWSVPQNFDATFNWDYDEGRVAMMGLYRKGVEMQWDANTRIDWTQEIDEARHVESYKRLLEKFGVAYPMTPPLQELIDQVLRDNRWDMTYLGMQVVIEGLALAAFQQIRDHAQNPLAAAVNAYVMQDESRHVAFGRLALRDYYPQLTQKERDEREEFLLEASYLMRDRFDAVELWQHLDLPIEECASAMYESGFMEKFRNSLFARIVPIVKDIGLWGDTIRKGYEEMGVIGYAQTDVQALQDEDDFIAKRFDARRAEVQRVIERAQAAE